MATSKGRKSTAKKKEEAVVESPKKEVIEPKVEEPKKAAPKKAVEEVAPAPVQEELPPPPPPPPAPKPAPVVEPVVEQVAVQAVAPAPRVVEVGSLVMMPSGKRGTVIAVNRKGHFEVRSEMSPRKIYLYESSQLSLV